jgi:glycosyltransferase involved in cell wall biosynthesis
LSENRPFFSIIIPTYNRAAKLRQALESVEMQTFRDFEVIVCDDGSTDDTGAVVSSFTTRLPLVLVREDNWGGPARPRNNGLKLATGEWVCFLDADDWWYPEKLAAVFAVTAGNDLIYHDVQSFSATGRKKSSMSCRHLRSPVFVDLLSNGNTLTTSSVCVRKVLFEKAGSFDEDKALIAVEDFDLWLRIANVTEKFCYLKKCLGGYLISDDSISSNFDTYVERHRALLKRHEKNVREDDLINIEAYWAYCFGVNKGSMGFFPESRESFGKALQSRRIKIVIKSTFRIFLSYLLQRVTRKS